MDSHNFTEDCWALQEKPAFTESMSIRNDIALIPTEMPAAGATPELKAQARTPASEAELFRDSSAPAC